MSRDHHVSGGRTGEVGRSRNGKGRSHAVRKQLRNVSWQPPQGAEAHQRLAAYRFPAQALHGHETSAHRLAAYLLAVSGISRRSKQQPIANVAQQGTIGGSILPPRPSAAAPTP
jgi:2-phospho-L-lactate transferase/gluconeogenesis factor (CofD/UPF0052 family)